MAGIAVTVVFALLLPASFAVAVWILTLRDRRRGVRQPLSRPERRLIATLALTFTVALIVPMVLGPVIAPVLVGGASRIATLVPWHGAQEVLFRVSVDVMVEVLAVLAGAAAVAVARAAAQQAGGAEGRCDPAPPAASGALRAPSAFAGCTMGVPLGPLSPRALGRSSRDLLRASASA